MTATKAHKPNQPLTAIINNASAGQCFIDHGDMKPDSLREILVDIAADGHRADDVIRQYSEHDQKKRNPGNPSI
jgi:hypothetical protein